MLSTCKQRIYFTIAGLLLTLSACGPTPKLSAPTAAPQARKLLGAALPYEPLALDAAAQQAVLTDAAARRARAWQVVATLLQPVPLPDGGSVPTWATWYGTDDVQRLFHKLYGDLGADGRRRREPFSAPQLEAAFTWNATMVDTLPNWPESRYDTWRRTLQDTTGNGRYHALAGLSRTLYAPQAASHLLRHYRGVKDCAATGNGASFAQPGRHDDNFTLCFADEFPTNAAIIKTALRRDDFDFMLPVYDTDPATLATKQAAAQGSWGPGERQADPGAGEIYTLKLDSGPTYRLAGLHIMTKDLREWLWITLWWSDRPDEDFGADRPAAVAALGAPWNQYKMCVVSGFEADAPDLSDDNAYSWCSNPYLEAGVGNQVSNCIGCHQHGGTTIASEVILSDATRFPGLGRQRVRHNFPADYLWSVSRDPERLGPWMADVVTHYDLHDPAPDGE